jgi:hypothetical protein
VVVGECEIEVVFDRVFVFGWGERRASACRGQRTADQGGEPLTLAAGREPSTPAAPEHEHEPAPEHEHVQGPRWRPARRVSMAHRRSRRVMTDWISVGEARPRTNTASRAAAASEASPRAQRKREIRSAPVRLEASATP